MARRTTPQKRLITSLFMLLGALWMPQAVGSASDAHGTEARDMLMRMVQALRTLNYSGVFVYLHGDQLETLEITHAVKDGQELERLISLNGSAREVRRDPRAVTCVMPDSKAVTVDHRTRGLWSSLDVDLDRLSSQYLLYPLGGFRVAGRASKVVGVIPKDKLRYGYRLYLDDETGLPLKTDLMNEDAKPIQQIMFTSLRLDSDGPTGVEPELRQEGFRRLVRDAPEPQIPDPNGNWYFRTLPAGFELLAHTRRLDHAGSAVEQFVLSEGLASISVYVEKGQEAGLQGSANVGAIHAWGDSLGAHHITAVGEVPADTLRLVVNALAHRAMEADG